jgi:hypothetical protein
MNSYSLIHRDPGRCWEFARRAAQNGGCSQDWPPYKTGADKHVTATLEQVTRKRFEWKLRDRTLNLGDRTLIIGILNVTPDSFSDGGAYLDPDRAFARAIELEELGADVLDIGAESTRPGALRISEAEELRRLVPVLKRLKGKLSIPISVSKSSTTPAPLPSTPIWHAKSPTPTRG